ncbi:MAG TPA: FHA domain-containing protein [Chloroflexota bacterium]|jgi:pSer/pThr/pTyr-binding forkhead associated (FHA) protein
MQLAPDVAILALRFLLVALIYAFLLFVVVAARRSAAPPAARAAPLMPRRLVVLEGPAGGPDRGVALALHPQTTIGRAADNIVVVADPVVSGHHAHLLLREEAWWVEDLGSTNGTFLNDLAVSAPQRLVAGDEVQVGPARFRLEP